MALEHFHPYLIGKKLKVITDHANLKFLASIAPQNSKLARLCLSLTEFDFEIEHRAGKHNIVPDTLRRAPFPLATQHGDTLMHPPTGVTIFLLTILTFDISNFTCNNIAKIVKEPFLSLNLAFLINTPNNFATSPPQSRKANIQANINTPSIHMLTADQQLPFSPDWPKEYAFLQLLNKNRVEFAKVQFSEIWLCPPITYLASNLQRSKTLNIKSNSGFSLFPTAHT